MEDMAKEIKGDDRRTRRILTKYEYARLLGTRTNQISKGAEPLELENPPKIRTPENIAKGEIRERKSIFKIKRIHPNGDYEIFKLNELKINNY